MATPPTPVTQGGGVDLKAARLSLAAGMLPPNWHKGSESAASREALTPAHASTPSFDLAARRDDPGDGTRAVAAGCRDKRGRSQWVRGKQHNYVRAQLATESLA